MGAKETGSPAQRPVARRRRGAALVAAITDATRAELAENGFDGVTFERIARRASLSKATLYGRYRSPAHLIAEAIAADAREVEMPSTGSLRGDLVLIMTVALEIVDRFGPAVYRRLIGYADDSVTALLAGRGVLRGEAALIGAVTAARERGELGSAEIPRGVLLAPIDILHSRVLLADDLAGVAASIVDDVAIPLWTAVAAREEEGLPDRATERRARTRV